MTNLKLDTIHDFDTIFDTDEKASDFFFSSRYPDGIVKCPKCKCEKIWITRSGKMPYKCSNKECYFTFSLRSLSLIHASNLSFTTWLRLIFYYTSSKGKMSSSQMGEQLNFATTFLVDEKLKLIFDNIAKTGRDNYSVFEDAVKNIFILNDKRETINSKTLLNSNFLLPTEILDFNKKLDYSKIIAFIKKTLYFYLHKRWIFILFCEPEDVMAEMFITIIESGVKECTGSFIKKMVYKTTGILWRRYCKEHPSLDNHFRNYHKEWQRDNARRIGKWYLAHLLSTHKCEWGASFKEVRKDNELLNIKKAEIIEYRKKHSKFRIED